MKNKRLTIELSGETVQKLETLKDELGLGSTVDVLRMAVQVLFYLEKERKQGYDIILRKEGDSGVREKEPVLVGAARI